MTDATHQGTEEVQKAATQSLIGALAGEAADFIGFIIAAIPFLKSIFKSRGANAIEDIKALDVGYAAANQVIDIALENKTYDSEAAATVEVIAAPSPADIAAAQNTEPGNS